MGPARRGFLAVACALALAAGPAAGGQDPDRIVIEEDAHGVELHAEESRVRVVDDPSASNRRAVWLKENEAEWILQWQWMAPEFVTGITYRVYLRAAPAREGDPQASIRGGVFQRFTLGQGKTICQFDQPVRPPAGEKWVDVLVGEVPLNQTMGYVYVLSRDSPLLVDHVSAVPVLTPENREAYRSALDGKRAERERKEKRLAEIRSRVRPRPELARVFVYGVASAREAVLHNAEVIGVDWEWGYRQMLRDIRRHGGNFNYQLSVDAAHPEFHPTCRIMEEEGIWNVNGDVKVLPSIFSVGRSVDEAKLKEFFAREVPRCAAYRHFLAWSLADEPQAEKLYDYLVGKEIVESLDPRRPAIPILNTEKGIELFGPYQQVIVPDYYTLKVGREDPWAVGDRVALARKQGAAPVWLMYGAYSNVSGGRRTMRMANRAEARVMIYQGLLNGATGFAGYVYGMHPFFSSRKSQGHPDTLVDAFGTPSEQWDEVGRIGKDLVPVGNLLVEAALDPVPRVKADAPTISAAGRERPAVQVATWRLGETMLVLAVNNDLVSERRVRIPLGAGLGRGAEALHLYEMRRQRLSSGEPASAGAVEATLKPGDGMFWAVGAPSALDAIEGRIWGARREQELSVSDYDLELMGRHGLDAAPWRKKMEAVPAGPQAGERFAALRSEILAELEARAGVLTLRKQLAAMQADLSEGERLLESRLDRGRKEVMEPLIKAWLDQARAFGKLRYSLEEGKALDRAALAAGMSRAASLKGEIARAVAP